jgi:hypothetical protein
MLGVSKSYRSQSFCLFVACAAVAFVCRVESFSAPLVMMQNNNGKHVHSQSTLHRQNRHPHARAVFVGLYASSPLDKDGDQEKNIPDDSDATSQPRSSATSTDYSTEEILLCVHLEVLPESGVSVTAALEQVQAYSQSFPFAAVLPVQPLMYLPTTEGGVEIKFLRKKTDEKSGMDGGLCFFIETTEPEAATQAATENNDNMVEYVNDDDTDHDNDDDQSRRMISVTVKRNSVGQTIRKIVAERLVVTSYVASLTAAAATATGSEDVNTPAIATATPSQGTVVIGSRPSPVAEQVVRVTSLFHKWM